jgi:hypothetical protein
MTPTSFDSRLVDHENAGIVRILAATLLASGDSAGING